MLLIPLALLVSVFVFLLASIVPGGPVAAIVGNHPLNEVTIEAIKHKYHLDEPIYQQYWRWLTQAVLHHDLGRSILTQTPVTSSISDRIIVTLTLNLGGIGFALLFGVPLGVIAAMRRGRALDRAVVSFTIFAGNAPAFVVSLIALYVFGLKLGVVPAVRRGLDELRRPGAASGAAHDRAGHRRHGADHADHARGDARAARPGLHRLRPLPRR